MQGGHLKCLACDRERVQAKRDAAKHPCKNCGAPRLSDPRRKDSGLCPQLLGKARPASQPLRPVCRVTSRSPTWAQHVLEQTSGRHA